MSASLTRLLIVALILTVCAPHLASADKAKSVGEVQSGRVIHDVSANRLGDPATRETGNHYYPFASRGADAEHPIKWDVVREGALSSEFPAEDPDDIYWDNSIAPSIPGVTGYVYAVAVYDGCIVVGGAFYVAGDQLVHHIAVWDGINWSSLGSGMNGPVRALTVYEGELIAGGEFTTAGGLEVNYIAAWDGATWSSLGSMIDSHVYALTLYDGMLIAGGYFWEVAGLEANCVAAWDGISWSSLGSGVGGPSDPYSYVLSLAVYDGELVVGGTFTVAGGVAANHIASWDGSSWSALGSGMVGSNVPRVSTLAAYDGKLVAGGNFYSAGGVSTRDIAAWDGTVWSSLGSGLDGYVEVLHVYDGTLVAGGYFNNAGSVWVSGIAAWNGSDWSPLGSGVWGEALALTVFNGDLIAGGTFTAAGDAAALSIASWHENDWSAFGSGANAYVSALTVYDGKLVAGGAFAAIGEIAASRIALWEGDSWTTMGSGMSSNPGWSSSVRAFAEYDGNLIAGGDFRFADGVEVNRIASWSGSSWSPLGGGVAGPVSALLVRDGKLIAGAGSVVSWDGTEWTALGAGFNSSVCALAEYDGELIAGGWFTEVGGVKVNYIAAWDGISWSPLGSGIGYYGDNTRVGALAVYDGKLIAAGHFSSAGGATASGIAFWDGVSWQSMGEYHGEWPSFIFYDGKLILEDAAWDGSVWSTLGSGVSGGVMSHTIYDEKLVVGGSFAIAGNKVAGGLAMWTKRTPTDVEAEPDVMLPGQFALRQNYPNPFNPATTVDYEVPQRSWVRIEILNILGQRVCELVNEPKSPGKYSVTWTGVDQGGRIVASGVYLYRMQAGSFEKVRKMLLTK